jgi:enoyl-CoA hydratase
MDNSGEKLVILSVEQGIATVTLNRPEARNALSSALLGQLRSGFRSLANDGSVGAVILTGRDPAFCAGLDLKELSTGARLAEPASGDDPPWLPWPPLGKPLIGAINGAAITGGFELALNCDFLIASERAVFADTHARVGVLPAWGLSVLLPQRVGFAMARRMSFTGDFVDAETALRAGLVTEVVSHDLLLATAKKIAATIVANNRPAILALHESYRQIEAAVIGTGLELEQETARGWRDSGGMSGLAERVPGVFSRGREQAESLARTPAPQSEGLE